MPSVSRAGKQTRAYWRSEQRHVEKTGKDPLYVVPSGTPYHFEQERRRSFASGWLAGVRWAKRNLNGK